MSTYLMDLKQVCHAVGFKKTTIYKWMNAGEFPVPIKIGDSARWVSEEVDVWIAAKIIESRTDSNASNKHK